MWLPYAGQNTSKKAGEVHVDAFSFYLLQPSYFGNNGSLFVPDFRKLNSGIYQHVYFNTIPGFLGFGELQGARCHQQAKDSRFSRAYATNRSRLTLPRLWDRPNTKVQTLRHLQPVHRKIRPPLPMAQQLRGNIQSWRIHIFPAFYVVINHRKFRPNGWKLVRFRQREI